MTRCISPTFASNMQEPTAAGTTRTSRSSRSTIAARMRPAWRAPASPVTAVEPPYLGASGGGGAAADATAASPRSCGIDATRARASGRRLRLHRAPGAVPGARDAACRALRQTPVRDLRRHRQWRRECNTFFHKLVGRGFADETGASTTAHGSTTSTTSRCISSSARCRVATAGQCRRVWRSNVSCCWTRSWLCPTSTG